MNYELLKRRMTKFFSETSAEQLMCKFKELGYEFYRFSPTSDIGLNEVNCKGEMMLVSANPYMNLWRTPPPINNKNKSSKKDLETSQGLFFFVRLHHDASPSS